MHVSGWNLLTLLAYLVPVAVLYVVVRLAVRHGVQDAHRARER